MCGPEGIENGYEGVVDPDDERELFKGGRFLPGANRLHSAAIKLIINILYLRVIVYFRGQVSKPLYAAVVVVLPCGPLPLDRFPGTYQSHATWVEEIRKACFSAVKVISRDPKATMNAMRMEEVRIYGIMVRRKGAAEERNERLTITKKSNQ